jgi:hypothetical protein
MIDAAPLAHLALDLLTTFIRQTGFDHREMAVGEI